MAPDGNLVEQTDTGVDNSGLNQGPSVTSRVLPSRLSQYTEAPFLILIDLANSLSSSALQSEFGISCNVRPAPTMESLVFFGAGTLIH